MHRPRWTRRQVHASGICPRPTSAVLAITTRPPTACDPTSVVVSRGVIDRACGAVGSSSSLAELEGVSYLGVSAFSGRYPLGKTGEAEDQVSERSAAIDPYPGMAPYPEYGIPRGSHRPTLSLLRDGIRFFPFQKRPKPRPHIQIYVGRDLSMDLFGREVSGCRKKYPGGDEFDRVVECAQNGYRDEYGSNFHLMVLAYPDFLRVVITIQADVVTGDNTWFIQDFPKLAEGIKYEDTVFEQDLRRHVKELGCPDAFVKTYMKRGRYDFSAANVHLVTSRPGSFSGKAANWYGQLRLREVVPCEILELYSKANPPSKMAFEVCVGSVGHLENEGVIKQHLKSCAGALQKSIEGKPALKLIFPTSNQVNLEMHGAKNISSHINWNSLKEGQYLKRLFHRYYSKDPDRLFHLKPILALRADNPEATPIYMYTGSAKFSQSAWGAVKEEGRDWMVADTLVTERVEKIANYECGVVIKGEDIARMLETGKWENQSLWSKLLIDSLTGRSEF
ncbi:tyrosyl-DNA phosphodiesterase-domain-containing protein [Mycena sanguinolenta]|nr:tyrosyl-DNA phosphodiesterase-domain-containing protein [Mycena sanguinolenta]